MSLPVYCSAPAKITVLPDGMMLTFECAGEQLKLVLTRNAAMNTAKHIVWGMKESPEDADIFQIREEKERRERELEEVIQRNKEEGVLS